MLDSVVRRQHTRLGAAERRDMVARRTAPGSKPVSHQAAMQRRALVRARRRARERVRAGATSGRGRGSASCARRVSGSSTSAPTRRGCSSRTSPRTGELVEVDTRRAYLGLGEEIARSGSLRAATVERTTRIACAYVRRARAEGAEQVCTLVTAPGRQDERAPALVHALERSTRAPVRVLSAEEEGRLAFEGVVHRAPLPLPEVVSVVDVGGGSTEVAVGTPLLGPAWVSSIDLGSLRLAQLCLEGDPPHESSVRQAQRGCTPRVRRPDAAPPRRRLRHRWERARRRQDRGPGARRRRSRRGRAHRDGLAGGEAREDLPSARAPGTDDPCRGGAPARGSRRRWSGRSSSSPPGCGRARRSRSPAVKPPRRPDDRLRTEARRG